MRIYLDIDKITVLVLVRYRVPLLLQRRLLLLLVSLRCILATFLLFLLRFFVFGRSCGPCRVVAAAIAVLGAITTFVTALVRVAVLVGAAVVVLFRVYSIGVICRPWTVSPALSLLSFRPLGLVLRCLAARPLPCGLVFLGLARSRAEGLASLRRLAVLLVSRSLLHSALPIVTS